MDLAKMAQDKAAEIKAKREAEKAAKEEENQYWIDRLSALSKQAITALQSLDGVKCQGGRLRLLPDVAFMVSDTWLSLLWTMRRD